MHHIRAHFVGVTYKLDSVHSVSVSAMAFLFQLIKRGAKCIPNKNPRTANVSGMVIVIILLVCIWEVIALGANLTSIDTLQLVQLR